MRMMKMLCGLAVLPLLAGLAFAETPKADHAKKPTQLTEKQMDKVTAGWEIRVIEVYNTGYDYFSSYQTAAAAAPDDVLFPGPGNTVSCTGAYLCINNNALSIASGIFGGPIAPAAGGQ
jgi:hypothetical protein